MKRRDTVAVRKKKKTLSKRTSVPNDEVSVEVLRLIDRLRFDGETIVEDAMEQPRLFIEAARYRVRCLRKAMQARMALDTLRAELGAKARQQLSVNDERVTERKVEEVITSNAQWRKALELKQAVEAEEEMAKLLIEAFRQRQSCLKVVSDMATSEISLQAASESYRQKIDEVRKGLRKRYGV